MHSNGLSIDIDSITYKFFEPNIFSMDHNSAQIFDKSSIMKSQGKRTIENTPVVGGIFAVALDRFRI
jgi:hypothetical protein